MPTWTKEMALEIIAAGYKSMARKYHPDVGGTHDQMLDLTATREHLEKNLSGGNTSRSEYSWERQRAREREESARRREEEERKRRYWSQQQQTKPGEVPIKPYPHDDDYFMLEDVTVMAITEKAYKIKIPGVKAPQWLPKSQLNEDYMADAVIAEGDVVNMVFSRWIAQQKGWLK